MTREQNRARHAYECVRTLDKGLLDDYKIAVNGLAPQVFRSGLAGAMAFLERNTGTAAVPRLLDDLSKAAIPGFPAAGKEIPGAVRKMELADYMLATRELIRVILWFKRAVQAAATPGVATDA